MKLKFFCLIYGTFILLFTDAMHNGEYRSVKDYPFIVQLYHEFKYGLTTNCGAAILSEYWVVSAAHCVGHVDYVKSQVRIGSSATLKNGILIDVEQIYVYGDYDPDFAWDSDISLIKLKNPIKFNEYQQPIEITRELPKIGDNVTVLGFGDNHYFIEGHGLRAAEVSVIEDKVCLQKYNQKYSENMICTSIKNIDLCFGDSGGPAVHNNKLVGIISQGCEYTKPNILTKVANYYDWIRQTTGIKFVE